MYYLRKITRGKWPSETILPHATLENIAADTVVSELKTDKNKLSVWKIENEEDLNDAFIALASNCDSCGRIDAIKIDEKYLSNFVFDNEEGDTPTKNINKKHRNICELNYVSLGIVIESIIKGLNTDCLVYRTRPEIRKMLVEAYEDDRLLLDQMSEKIVGEIKKAADIVSSQK